MRALSPLAAGFGAAVRVRNALYDRGVLTAKRLDWPVVSIGNLRAGGAGKTPFTIHIGKLLQEKGIAFDILTRGYRRDDEKSIKLVDPNGSTAEYGDEPLLLSRKLNIPVIVGADRHAAGRFAEKMFAEVKPSHGRWIHLLDDGFQHRRLHRHFDIVLVGTDDSNDSLLPAGSLREPLSALKRADAIVLVDGAKSGRLPVRNQQVWHAQRTISVPSLPMRAVAFCGIARPERFFRDLQNAGVDVVGHKIFRDHHAYAEKDIIELVQLRKEKNADGFVTTEKDLINLQRNSAETVRQLQRLEVISMELGLEDSGRAIAAILEACAIPQSAETINRL